MQVFPEHVHCPMHELLVSQKCFWTFQIHLWISHSPVFLLSFLVSLLFDLLYNTSGSYSVWQSSLVFNKCLGEETFCTVCAESSQITSALLTGTFRELTDRWNSENSLEVGLWGSSNPVLPLLGVLLFFVLTDCGLSVFKDTADPRREEPGNSAQVKLSQILESLQIISCFSWINIPQIAANLWLISTVLRVLILTVFANVLFAFMEEIIWFEFGPHSTSFADICTIKWSFSFKLSQADYDFSTNCIK